MAKIGQWNYAPQYIDQLPSYWHLNHSKKGQILSYKEAERSKAAITNAVLQTWDQNSIGQGQDAEGLTSCGIKILSVKRLENSVLYSNYLQEREHLIAACKERGEWCPGIQKLPGSAEPVLSTDILPNFMKRELCSKVNEVYVFHGTKAENIKSISVNGLNLGYSNPNRLFGQAIYTTESSTKADQYTDPKDARSHPGSDLYMILSRVLLGRVFVCDSRDKIPYLQGPPCTSCNVHNCTCVSPSHYDSIMADGDWMFREFAVHHDNRCYPEYIIKYRRERKPAFNLAGKELTMSESKAVINNAYMSEDMQMDAVDCATQALKKYNTEEDIAVFIKKEFDKKYNGEWQCFVGGHFGSSISHDTDHYIFFSFGRLNILLFKCK